LGNKSFDASLTWVRDSRRHPPICLPGSRFAPLPARSAVASTVHSSTCWERLGTSACPVCRQIAVVFIGLPAFIIY